MQENSDIEFKLSLDSVKDIPFDIYEQDFAFIVDGKEYRTNRIVADLLSPIIRANHKIDRTMNKFYVNTKLNSAFDFSDFLSLISFETKKIQKDQLKYYINIFYSLGNIEAVHRLFPQSQQEITVKNVFELINDKQNYFNCDQSESNKRTEINNSCFCDIFDKEINFIASHFSECDQEKIKKLDISLIQKIVESENLRLEDEDSLLKIVNDLYSEDHQLSFLYEYVNFLNVSVEEIKNFYEIFDVNDINIQIWKKIIDRILNIDENKNRNKKEKKKDKEKDEDNGLSFKYESGKEFNGIIKYLTQKTGGNIHDNGTIEVTSNSVCGSKGKNLLDFNEESYFEASPDDSWVCFDFKNRKVKITNYSIKSHNLDFGHLKSWDIEVSNDNKNWTKIDERRDCPTLNQSGIVGTFEVQPNNFSRYVRLHQTDEPWVGSNLWFYYMEFYGFLQE